ncbi:hypothetical protein SAMN05428979_0828 [Stappia sp. ES.058]|nr:hypothetical protein SAMN05428979_0828 [Stappia sp. ES.058]
MGRGVARVSDAEMEAMRKAVTDLNMTVGRLAGTVETMVLEFRSERESSAKSRKGVYQALEEVRREQHRVANEVKSTAARVERMEPAVDDYNRRQVQLETGGKLARAAWWIGGFVMFAAVWIVSNWEKITGAFRGWGGR